MPSFPRDEFLAKHGSLVAFFPRWDTYLLMAVGNTLAMGRVADGEILKQWQMPNSIWSIAANTPYDLDPELCYVAAGDEQGTCRIWRLSEAEATASLSVGGQTVHDMAFTGKGQLLFVATCGGLWAVSPSRAKPIKNAPPLPLKPPDEQRRRPSQTAAVGCSVTYHENGFVAAYTYDGFVDVWRPPTDRWISSHRSLLGQQATIKPWRYVAPLPVSNLVTSLAFSPSGSLLAGAIYNGITLWSVPDFKQVATLQSSGSYNSLSWKNDTSLAAGGESGLDLWRTGDRRPLQVERFDSRVLSVACVPGQQGAYVRLASGAIKAVDL